MGRRENNGEFSEVARGQTLVLIVITVPESSLDRLLELRSKLAEEVLVYLDEVETRSLPSCRPISPPTSVTRAEG